MAYVIDTDVGTDVDDLFALTYALKHPNSDVKAITTVIGDTEVRGKIVKKLEKILGVNVPIIAGESGNKEVVRKYWTGIEEKALTLKERKEPFDPRRFPSYDSDMNLVCIGPLTNIARQLRNSRTIRRVRDIYVMGSLESSHNFRLDLDAKEKVFSCDWNIYQITTEVSKKVSFDRRELEGLKGNELGDFLYSSATRWLDYSKREKCCMYDVLAVSAGLDDGLVKFKNAGGNRFVSYDVNPDLKDRMIRSIKS